MNQLSSFLKKHSNFIIAIGVIICAVILIAPILNIAIYNMPSTDDYSYGLETHHAWVESHNVFNVIKEAFKRIGTTYQNWQGTYSAVFFFALQPSIFGVQFYSITTFVLLFTLLLAHICLVKTIAKKLFNYTKNSIVFIISLILTLFAIETLPDPVQSLFWWNGSTYYTFFFSIMLITIASIINFITSKSKKGQWGWFILSTLLSAFLSGGNYPTALSYTLILAIITLSLFILKNKKKYYMVVMTAITAICFLISMIAPGNSVRQSVSDNSLGAVKSVLFAIFEGTKLIYNWTNLIVVVEILILIPFIYQIISKSKFEFRYPLIFTIISFGVFFAQLVPPLYAMNSTGEGRLIDLVYYSYYWLLILNVGYYLGWIQRKFSKETNSLMEYINDKKLIYVFVLFMVLILICFPTKKYKDFTSYKAINSLVNGEAVSYHDEVLERYKILEDDDIKDVSIKPLQFHPSLLYVFDFTEDTKNWVNVAASMYFNKNYISIEK